MSHPGRYDVTAGGHVSAGELPEDAVLRETQEEIGLRLDTDRLQSLGYVKEVAGNDREIAYLYVYEEANPSLPPRQGSDLYGLCGHRRFLCYDERERENPSSWCRRLKPDRCTRRPSL